MIGNLIKQRRFLLLLQKSKAAYIRGFWPEPISQQTLAEFLKDINYFDEPQQYIDIGRQRSKVEALKTVKANPFDLNDEIDVKPEKVDELLNLLSHEAEAPPLDFNDVRLEGKDLINLAISSGVFRDLFTEEYTPDRDHIKFTKEQAERLDKLIPDYWITDQPYARVNNNPKPSNPLPYFEPIVGIFPKFINTENSIDKEQTDNDVYAHTSYYGNLIPAEKALSKPTITLDGRLLSNSNSDEFVKENQFDNWVEGQVKLVNFGKEAANYYSIVLVNLDYLHENSSNLHWMITNLEPSNAGCTTNYEEVCSYLPVHGIKGFGYSRYVFLVFQHDSKLNSSDMKIKDFSLDSRKFNARTFIDNNKSSGITPVGLSWFQTTWDITSNRIFHDYLNIKAPIYDHVQTRSEPQNHKDYPGIIPFNILLDYERDKKDINEQVLLERLKSVDPYDYKDQYVPPKVPPTVFQDEKRSPDWMTNVLFKKKNKIGYWRGLRPASAVLPLDNNADLDYPIRPVESSKKGLPEQPNLYPGGPHRKVSVRPVSTKELESKDQTVYIQEDHEVHLDEVMKIMKEFESKKTISESTNKKSSR